MTDFDAAQKKIDDLTTAVSTLTEAAGLLSDGNAALNTDIADLTKRVTAQETQMLNVMKLLATNNPGSVTPPPPPPGVALFPHASFKHLNAQPASNTTSEKLWMKTRFEHMQNGVFADYPNALWLSTYALLWHPEIDSGAIYSSANGGSWTQGQEGGGTVAYSNLAAAYCAAHGLDVEKCFLHARTTDKNYPIQVSSVSALGVVTFTKAADGTTQDAPTSYPLTIGQKIQLGTFGLFPIVSLQQRGVTVSGWTAGLVTAAFLSYIPGDGQLSKANRLRSYAWTEWRDVLNPGSAESLQFHAARVNGLFGADQNGLFYDEMDATMLSRCRSLEYGDTLVNGVPSAGGNQYITDICTLLAAQKAALTAGRSIRVNTANYQTPNDIKIINSVKAAHCETIMSLVGYQVQSDIDFVIARLAEGNLIECITGATWSATNPGVLSASGASTPGNYLDRTGRADMSIYCWYLMVVDATTPTQFKRAIFSNDNSNVQGVVPLSARWSPAFEYKLLGQPFSSWLTGYTVAQTGTIALIGETAPVAYKLLQRRFSLDGITSSALVLFNTMHGQNPSGAQHSSGDDSAVTYIVPSAPTGKVWKMLNRDGSLGATISSAVVRNGEGLILIAA